MINKEGKKININILITLCEIIEDYKSFYNDYENLIKTITNRDLARDAYKFMMGNFSIRASKYTNFINKHKDTIEIMKRNHSLFDLVFLSYDKKGRRRDYPKSIDYFYNYIEKHQKDKTTIKAFLLKLKQLGFNEIIFDEDIDFTKETYSFHDYRNISFSFLENMEACLTYPGSTIKYKSNDSSYCMHLSYDLKKEIEYDKEIYLNTLIINPNRLPDELTFSSTVEVIKKLVDDKKDEYSDIKKSVDLSVATSDLLNEFKNLKQVISEFKNDELSKEIDKMEGIIEYLQIYGSNFIKKVADSNLEITGDVIEEEIKLYLNKRIIDRMDFN